MKELSHAAKIYLLTIYGVGCGLFIWNFRLSTNSDVWMLIVLALLASVLHVFKVVGATVRSHYTFSFLIYGFTFARFGIGEMLVVILISNIAEWIWNRPPWFIQLFNIACYFISASGAFLTYSLINPSWSLNTPLSVLAVALSMSIFTLINHFILGIVLWLARGENFKVSRMMDFFPFLMDVTMLMVGCMLSLIWESNPFAMLLFLFPLYLIYTSLRIPALERQTELDQKTGLYNHQYFMEHLAKELDRSKRFDRPLSMIMLDLDLLRNINNTYGHLAGDEVLIGIARILKRTVREYDVVARFGGEEFAIILPETTIQQSFRRAEIIRQAIQGSEFSVPTSVSPIKITISLGVAERESFTQTPEEIIHNADTALYHSKLRGRNRSFAYRNDAYMAFLGDEQKFSSLSEDQIQRSLMEETARESAADQPATETSNIKTETVPASRGISSAVDKTSKSALQRFISQPQSVLIYIGLLALMAVLFIYGLYHYAPGLYQINWIQTWPGLLTCVVFVTLTELYSIDLFIGKTSLSTSAVPILAGTLLYGPIAGIILSITYSVVVGIKYKSKFNKYVFNFSNQAIAAMLYTIALQLFGQSLGEFTIAIQAVLVVMAALIVFIMTTGLISVGMGIDLRQSPLQIWKEQYAWLATIYIGIGLITTAFILGYREEGILGALLMMVPLFLLRISQKQYVDRTREAVTELREKNVSLVKSADEINQLSDGLLDTLAEIIDVRDPYVFGHSKRVTNYATTIAKKMGLNPKQVELIRKGGLLHDVGKLGISMDILSKPGSLSSAEFEEIKHHPEIGGRVLETNPSLRLLVPIVRHHHEFYNGEGYPDGLSGIQIPIEARIVSVADAIESMASDRPYRKARSNQYIIDEIKRFAGTQFDPKVVEHTVRLLESNEISPFSNMTSDTVFAKRDKGNETS